VTLVNVKWWARRTKQRQAVIRKQQQQQQQQYLVVFNVDVGAEEKNALTEEEGNIQKEV
jgi:hypothetical protein